MATNGETGSSFDEIFSDSVELEFSREFKFAILNIIKIDDFFPVLILI